MKNKNALILSRNFPYNLGGAERSLLQELKTSDFDVVRILHAKQLSQANNILPGIKDLTCNVESLPNFSLFSRFFYYEYAINKKRISEHIQGANFDVLITQNRWAPAAINAANKMGKESVYYLRDETSLGILNNYYIGPKYLLRNIYKAMEMPGIRIFNKDNELALNNASKVIANSNFMASLLWDKYKVNSTVVYPKLNKDELLKSYQLCFKKNNEHNDGIVMIGDNRIKGVELFIKLAKRFPEEQFYIFGKNSHFKSPLKNVKHLGWSVNAAYPYSRAKLVLVPSLWDEAFGRVAIEALLLKIPVLVSNRGGLPEAVNYNQEQIANDYNEFVKKILRII